MSYIQLYIGGAITMRKTSKYTWKDLFATDPITSADWTVLRPETHINTLSAQRDPIQQESLQDDYLDINCEADSPSVYKFISLWVSLQSSHCYTLVCMRVRGVCARVCKQYFPVKWGSGAAAHWICGLNWRSGWWHLAVLRQKRKVITIMHGIHTNTHTYTRAHKWHSVCHCCSPP